MELFNKSSMLKTTKLKAKTVLIGQAGQIAHDVMLTRPAVGGMWHSLPPLELAVKFDELLTEFYNVLDKRQADVFKEAEKLANDLASTMPSRKLNNELEFPDDESDLGDIPGMPKGW